MSFDIFEKFEKKNDLFEINKKGLEMMSAWLIVNNIDKIKIQKNLPPIFKKVGLNFFKYTPQIKGLKISAGQFIGIRNRELYRVGLWIIYY